MDNLRYANIALDWFCLVLSILPVVYLVSNQRYREKLNQYFLGACLSNMVMTLGGFARLVFSNSECLLAEESAHDWLHGVLYRFCIYPLFLYLLHRRILGCGGIRQTQLP